MRLINADELKERILIDSDLVEVYDGVMVPCIDFEYNIDNAPTVEAIPVEQLLSILPKYDDYIHTKTYPYNETMEDIYSKGHEEGWNACLKAIKEELNYWKKENDL